MNRFHTVVLLFVLVACSSSNEPSSQHIETLPSDCEIFLEDYNMEVSNYLKIQNNIELKGEDINLIIARNSAEESIVAMQSDPTLFKCSSNILFQNTIDSLNGLMDH